MPECEDINLDNEINNYYILIYDIFKDKNKIELKTKLKILDEDLYIIKFMLFKNKYLIVSRIKNLRVFNINNMKEIFPQINNLKLKDGSILDLMNFNNDFF